MINATIYRISVDMMNHTQFSVCRVTRNCFKVNILNKTLGIHFYLENNKIGQIYSIHIVISIFYINRCFYFLPKTVFT